MSLTNKKFTQSLLICQHCNGTGVSCKECALMGMALWIDGWLFFWGRDINAFTIYLHKAQKILFQIFNLIFFIFGILGIFTFISAVLFLGSLFQSNPFARFFMLIFYFSLLTDAYLIARIITYKKTKKIPTVAKKTTPAETPGSLSAALTMNRLNRRDISHYFNIESLDAIENGWEIAKRNRHANLESLHFFGGLFTKGATNMIFARLNISKDSFIAKIKRKFQKMPQGDHPIISSNARRALLYAFFEAKEKKQKDVNIINLLMSTFISDTFLQELFYEENINITKMTHVIQWLYFQDQLIARYKQFHSRAKLKPKTTMNRAMTALSTPILDALSQDLTLYAKYGYIDMVVGREREINELFRIIESGSRSVILVGSYGVGKRSIINALSLRMVSEDVPELLQDKRLVALSIAKLVAGVNPAEAQGRLLRIIEEIERAKNVILVVEGIEDMIGITSGEAESLDLSEVLAKAVSLGRIIAIATATPANYTRFIESSAIGEAFHKIFIDEPTIDQTIYILEAKAPSIEYQHKVFFSYSALDTAARLAKRYIHSQYLPEKALNIIEQVAVYAAKTRGEKTMITAEDVEYIISQKTKIPVSRVSQNESEILLNLEDKIHKYIIDQEEAVKMVATSLRRARAQLRDQGRPIVNLLFLGPTGVGKTELAKTVAKIYLGGEGQMIRLDMSEYQDKPSVYRMIGTPLGSSGDSDGYLTEAVRHNPFSLLLLDEMEKAHPDILNIFLQVMDDGRLTDNQGRTIDFTNVILIATSNAGTQYIQDEIRKGTPLDIISDGLMNHELKSYYRPEFLNRFDGIVVFKPLSGEDVQEIAKLFLAKVATRLEKQGIRFEYMPQALQDIAKKGFSPEFGARPLRRAIQEYVDDELAKLILSGKLTRRDTVRFVNLDNIQVIKAQRL